MYGHLNRSLIHFRWWIVQFDIETGFKFSFHLSELGPDYVACSVDQLSPLSLWVIVSNYDALRCRRLINPFNVLFSALPMRKQIKIAVSSWLVGFVNMQGQSSCFVPALLFHY